jgi:hypothetical protein
MAIAARIVAQRFFPPGILFLNVADGTPCDPMHAVFTSAFTSDFLLIFFVKSKSLSRVD